MFPNAEETRVLIVGDSPLARAGLAALLNTQPGLNIVGQAAADELERALAVYRAETVAWDVGWEPARALGLLDDLRDAAPPVLALLSDPAHAPNALAAGARGLLAQDADAPTIAAALAALARGLAVLSPALLSAALPPRLPERAAPADALTARELEVLALVAEGLPNKVIANRLKISEHTVKFHVNAIMSKLGVQSRTEAVVRATRLGLIML
jgi:DNA-binding NarL/FixJ family response regulator